VKKLIGTFSVASTVFAGLLLINDGNRFDGLYVLMLALAAARAEWEKQQRQAEPGK
jgi:hypothetical protein